MSVGPRSSILLGLLVPLAVGTAGAASASSGRAADDQALEKVRELGAIVRSVSRDDASLEVDFHLHGRELSDADLPAVAKLGNIVRLDLGSTKVSDAGLQQLSGLTGLRSLSLANTGVDGSGLVHLSSATGLEVVNLYGSKATDAVLQHFAAFPNLERVYLWKTAVSYDAASAFVMDRPRVLLDRGFDAEPLPTQFRPTTKTRAVAVERIAEIGGSMRRIAQDSEAMEVDFHLGGTAVADADLHHVRSVTPLHELNLAGSQITDAGLFHVSMISELRRLHLQHTAVTDEGAAKLATLENLEYLNLYGTAVTDGVLDVLGTMPKLKKLYLWQTKVSWEGAELLRGRCPGLLVDRGWDADGPPAWIPPSEEERKAAEARIAELGGTIRRLDQQTEDVEVDFHLGGRELGDEDLVHVRRIPNLVELNLAYTKVTSQGMNHLAGLPKLERLHLENTVVDDSALEQLRYNTKLVYLNLYGTQVGDAGVARLRTLRNLRKLYLWQTKATAKGAEVLAGWLPELRIEFGWELTSEAKTEAGN